MESLTKENFWNELNNAYPEQMKEFCAWIDEYKKRVDWDGLFNGLKGPFTSSPKYHDLPIAMQLGIFWEFSMESAYDYQFIKNCPNTKVWPLMIIQYFSNIKRGFAHIGIMGFPSQKNDSTNVDHMEDMIKAMHGAANE